MQRGRNRGAWIVCATLLPMSLWVTGGAHAAAWRGSTGRSARAGAVSCTTAWVSAVSGNWNDPTKWTNGVPRSTCAAKITVAGIYTVTISGYTGSAATLTLGSGTVASQTLVVQATDNCGGASSAELSLAAGGSLATTGVIELTQSGSCGGGTPSLETTSGTLSNGGMISTVLGTNQTTAAHIDGTTTNTTSGQMSIGAPTAFGENISGSTLDNHGGIKFTTGDSLTTYNDAAVTDDSGGSIDGVTSGSLVMDGGTYTQGAGGGSTEYNPDVILNDASLNYTTGAGGAWIVAQGTTTLSGDPVGDLTIQATDFCSGATNAGVTAGSSLTNDAHIVLTQTGGCSGGTPSLTVEKPAVLTNDGVIRATAGPNQSTTAQLDGDITNTAFVDVDAPIAFGSAITGSTFDNRGDVALAATLTAENGAAVTDDSRGLFNNGSRNGSGPGHLLMDGGTYTQGAGRISQTAPVPTYPAVVLSSAALHYAGVGKGAILAEGSIPETGSLAVGQQLALESTDSCSGAQDVTLSPKKNFTNAGTITFTHAGGCASGSDTIVLPSGSTLSNEGTLSAVAGTAAGAAQIDGKVKSSGLVSVASGVTLVLDGTLTNMKTATSTLTGGKYSLSGDFEYDNPSFDTNGIMTNGAKLTLDGSGAFTDGDGENAMRDLASNTKALTLAGGEGLTTPASLSDSGTITLGGGSTLTVGGNYAQTSGGTLGVTLASPTSSGELVASGTSSLAGTFDVTQTYQATAGTTYTAVSSASRAGTFATVNTTSTVPGGATPQVSYTPTGVSITEVTGAGH